MVVAYLNNTSIFVAINNLIKLIFMKNFKKIAIAAIVVVIAGYTVYSNQKSTFVSSLVRANIEALANNEGAVVQDCFVSYTKAPDDDSLAYWDWICSECESYWLEYGSGRSTCSR